MVAIQKRQKITASLLSKPSTSRTPCTDLDGTCTISQDEEFRFLQVEDNLFKVGR